MNNFCLCLIEALSNRFKIDAIVSVSKKKRNMFIYRLINVCFNSVITFIRKYFEERRYFCEPYIRNFPKVNQSIKWSHDYILVIKKSNKKAAKNG